jgi:hypothetical protein
MRSPVGPWGVDTEIGGEDDESFGEVDAIPSSRGENAIVQDLEEFIEDSRMCLLDLVEKYDAEWLFPNRVGELAAHVVADVAGWGSDQALIGMLGAELGHVEADICAVVAEEQAGDCLREFRLADPGGTGQEGDAPRSASSRRLPNADDGAFHDVEHVSDGVRLPLHAAPHELVRRADLVMAYFAPRVFGDADLEPPNRIGDAVERDVFASGQLCDCAKVKKQEPFSLVHEPISRFLQVGRRGILSAGKPPHQRSDHGSPGQVVGPTDRYVSNTWIADQKPVGKVSFLVRDPDHRIEKWLTTIAGRARARRMGKDQCTRE